MPGKLRMLFDELDRLRGVRANPCLLWTFVPGVSVLGQDKGNLNGSQSHRSKKILLYIQGEALPFHSLTRKISSQIQAT